MSGQGIQRWTPYPVHHETLYPGYRWLERVGLSIAMLKTIGQAWLMTTSKAYPGYDALFEKVTGLTFYIPGLSRWLLVGRACQLSKDDLGSKVASPSSSLVTAWHGRRLGWLKTALALGIASVGL
jgi:hypothetical protein